MQSTDIGGSAAEQEWRFRAPSSDRLKPRLTSGAEPGPCVKTPAIPSGTLR